MKRAPLLMAFAAPRVPMVSGAKVVRPVSMTVRLLDLSSDLGDNLGLEETGTQKRLLCLKVRG